VGEDNNVAFGNKFPGGRLCLVVMNYFVAKVRAEVFAHFHAVTVAVVCRIDRLACQGKLFANNPHGVKENDEHALDFALHLSLLFRFR
jgi:hypothetical protein